MAAQSPRRQVELTPAAVSALVGIWQWNAERYGSSHADGYLRFLSETIESLAESDSTGRPVPGRPHLKYALIRRRARGHGHIAVYEVADDRLVVLRIFHTLQDWQAAMDDS